MGFTSNSVYKVQHAIKLYGILNNDEMFEAFDAAKVKL